METNSLSNLHGNFQQLRNMWSTIAQPQDKVSRSTSILSGALSTQHQQQADKKSSKNILPVLKITHETLTLVEPSNTLKNESKRFYFLIKISVFYSWSIK